jgi:hypothetical protein
MRIFEGILHFVQPGGGRIMPLHGDMAGSFRLRLCDYCVLFTLEDDNMHLRRQASQRSLPALIK